MKRVFGSLSAVLLSFLFAASAAFAGEGDVKVVYHLNEGLEQATNAMRNIRNHLNADPKAKIVVVTHSKGIDFLLEGAKDKNGNPYDVTVQDLKAKGVQFEVCRNTLTSRKIDASKVIPEASIVPSGVAEVARLQFKEGYAYLRI